MQAMMEVQIPTKHGEKSIAVYHCDIAEFDEPLDVMTVSAFYRSYEPTPRTLFYALYNHGIDVERLSCSPVIDLRELCNIWLSDSITDARIPISRIGCIEMSPYSRDRSQWQRKGESMIASIHAYFKMLEIASSSGIRIESLGMPVLGGGSQQISTKMIEVPLLHECLEYLKREEAIRKISIITYNPVQAYTFARRLEESHSVSIERNRKQYRETVPLAEDCAFISYSSEDKAVADQLCGALEKEGIGVWYAPRDIKTTDYASAIAAAILNCRYFVVILSRNSLRSEHVLNEIDLAFQEMHRNILFFPLRIDEESMGDAFRYYLSRQHWSDAYTPPFEQRLAEFVERIKSSRNTLG